ncbi:hypothetical protein RRG08_026984 [Elysia crispata]|uniref:Uncharacterized protein n=1 Tax=Elysia crispata TaxID=231223 RepID=A0AAE1DT72_9GAST|nr:hypothetical protein RRG08_026984 [Elysia crispata]
MVNVLGAYLLLLAVASHVQSKSQCHVGRYGPSCQYQCHCAGSAPCDRHDGSCSSGCEKGWFGAACQYGSIGFTVLENSALDWLTDQNDTTCNDVKETPVFLTLKKPISLGWSRIVVSSPARLRDVKLFYYIKNKEKSMECSGPKVNISDTIQDILCPTADSVTKVTVTINGKATRGLCSLYLSTECRSGEYGEYCNKNCNVHCAGQDNTCSHINGTCTEGCDPGYRGETCDQG